MSGEGRPVWAAGRSEELLLKDRAESRDIKDCRLKGSQA